MSSDFKECPEHLYIHWPFCSKKCHYCDFVAFQNHEQFQDVYHETLCFEIESFSRLVDGQKTSIKTIFLGGGTPSLYDVIDMANLFRLIRNNYDLSSLQEASIEVNPADVTEERLEAWQDCGINRLSMGVQALDDDLLSRLNRRQRIADVLRAIKLAPKYFERISVDLILGLPGVSGEKWKETLACVVEWPIQHISIYFLTIHEKTPLYFKIERGEHILPPDDTVINMFEYSIDFLAKHGFFQYEISNFAKKGYESVHNKAYWDRKHYKGFGIGASSFDGESRFVNHKNLSEYLSLYKNASKLVYETKEVLLKDQELLEYLMLSLRQRDGLDLHHVVYLLEEDKKSRFLSQVQELLEAQLVELKGGRLCLTPKGMLLENEIIMRLV